MNGFDHWALSAAIFIPIVGAVIIGFIPRPHEVAQKVVALLTTLATLGVGVYLIAHFNYDNSTNIFNQGADPAKGLQFAVNRPWIDVINSRYHVGIDGISLPLLVLSMLITVLCVIYSWDHFPEPHNPKAFLILMLILEVGMNGTFVAEDLILFFVFFELVLLPDVLHDRRLGRAQPAVRVDQVLPVHPVRLGADDPELPGPVLQGRQHLRHPDPDHQHRQASACALRPSC